MTVQTLHTAAGAPDVCTPARKPAAADAVIAVAAKIRDAFAVLHDVQWRAPWDEPGKRWVNLR